MASPLLGKRAGEQGPVEPEKKYVIELLSLTMSLKYCHIPLILNMFVRYNVDTMLQC